jgi:DnaK suppressor protein
MPRAAKDTKATKTTKVTSKKVVKAPVKAPAKAVKAPAKAVKAPAKAVKAPAKAAKAPAKAVKAPTAAKRAAKPAAKSATKTVANTAHKTASNAATQHAASTATKTANMKATKTSTQSTTKKTSGENFKNFEPYTPKRGEKYMNDQQLAHFRVILLKWKSELMQEVDRTVSHMKDEAANFPDPADRATQEEEFSLELRTRDRERKLIKKIDSTVELIDQKDYGYCETCGVEIGVQRLEARPTASQCIDCKTLAEIKEKQEMG